MPTPTESLTEADSAPALGRGETQAIEESRTLNPRFTKAKVCRSGKLSGQVGRGADRKDCDDRPNNSRSTEAEVIDDFSQKTGVSGRPLEAYFREVTRTALLTRAEEVELGRRALKGDLAARDHLIRANLRLVTSVARRWKRRGVPLEDLVQEGTRGLIRGVDRFDPERVTKLSTYVTWWIRHFIRQACAEVTVVSIPRYQTDALSAKADPGRPGRKFKGHVEAARNPVLSIDEHFDADARTERPDEIAAERDERENLYRVIGRAGLTQNERYVLDHRYGLGGGSPETLKAIGDALNLTRERIRQIELAAVAKIRRRMLA